MKYITRSRIGVSAVLLMSTFLAACSGVPKASSPSGNTGAGGPYTIGGTVTGLTGTGLVLQDNGGDNLAINAAGTFTFKTAVASGVAYAITVSTQPTGPAQTCAVTSGTGTAAANVTSVQVTCAAPAAFTVGGSVAGLTGTGLVLQDNGGDNLAISASGTFTFATGVVTGKPYAVTVLTQPSNPAQTCTVTNGSGTIAANVTNVQVTCGTGTFTIGGTVTGLAGSGLVLQDNGGDNLAVTKNGVFTFGTAVSVGAAYKVTVLTQPASPSQACSVSAGSGTANANVGTIVVSCSVGTISIGGSVSGLAGTGLVLQNNGGDNYTVAANGSFHFATFLASGSGYNVSILTQASNPSQTCTIAAGSGTTSTTNVTTVQIVCPAVFHTIGGQVVGLLGTNSGMVLQDNGGDNLPIDGNGDFTFVTPIAHGNQYDVNIFVNASTQPQGCTIWNYQGNANSDITTVVVDCGHNDWTWMDGANTPNPLGTNALPSTSFDASSPGGRKYPGTWTDASGNLWLFGGVGWDLTQTVNPVYQNDLWIYTGTQNYRGGLGNLWQKVAVSGSAPAPRSGALTWTDAAGTLWLFGGQDAGTDFLNDLWSFNTSSKTWTQVSPGGLNQKGTYGTQRIPAPGNIPGGRWGATARLDGSGNLWLFGGFGFDSTTSTPGLLNDLWKLNSGGQWTWVSGSNLENQTGVYGTQGTPDPANVPSGRQASISWIDSTGNFWLFGGYNLSSGGQPNAFNDLWEFSGGQWTWTSGSKLVNQPGLYGTQGTAATSNIPGARWSSVAWIDASNRLWLFGGEGFDATANGSLGDLWQFSSGKWTWMKGPSSVGQVGVYGVAPSSSDGSVWPHVTNSPGTRYGSGYWTTSNGEFWMLGGEGFDSTTTAGGNGLMNDLWRYLPYP
jgi:hypothetical protein